MSASSPRDHWAVRVLQIAVIPVLLIVVANMYTVRMKEAEMHASEQLAQAQIEASQVTADREAKMRLVELIWEHATDDDTRKALGFLMILEGLDPELAEVIRKALAETAPDDVVGTQVSANVAAAVRAEAARRAPESSRGDTHWYAVIGSYRALKDAEAAARNVPEHLIQGTGRVEIYLSSNGYYALVLGGRLADRDQAALYARMARTAPGPGQGSAYPWYGKGWTPVLDEQ